MTPRLRVSVTDLLTRPVAWQGRIVVWMVLLGVGVFATNQWLRLRSEIASGAVLLGGKSFVTRPVRAREITRIAHEDAPRATIDESVRVRPLKLSPKQEKALEGKFDLRLQDTDVAVAGVFEAPPAPRGAEVVVTVTPEGLPEVVVKPKPPAFLELGPTVVDVSVVAIQDERFGRVALSKDLRVGKLVSFARASYDLREESRVQAEVGLRLRF